VTPPPRPAPVPATAAPVGGGLEGGFSVASAASSAGQAEADPRGDGAVEAQAGERQVPQREAAEGEGQTLGVVGAPGDLAGDQVHV